MKNYKFFSLLSIIFTLILILSVMFSTYIIDPLFHFHKPNQHFSYTINDERYQNDGILRNFDYDAIITGTSMTENFKTSEFDELFDAKSVKTTFAGGYYKEINDNLKRAITYNNNIKYIVRGLDENFFFSHKDTIKTNFAYPTYLTDNNCFNDINYLLNKNLFIKKIIPVMKTFNYEKNGSITSFDDAYSWFKYFTYGKQAILKDYQRPELRQQKNVILQEEIDSFEGNIEQNIVSLIKDNPNIDFYYFFTPYSILTWDTMNRTGNMDRFFVGERMIIESLIEYENVHLFSFNDDFSLITNLDNYKDIAHYSEKVNSYILKNMKEHTHKLTKDNYEEYLEKIKNYYEHYDYDKLF